MSKRHRRRSDTSSILDLTTFPSRTVFVDECGFTGPDLLSVDQPLVAYAAVEIRPEAAVAEIAAVRQTYRNLLQSGEVKASTLLQSPRGRDPAASLLTRIAPRSRWVAHHKRFALAANFVEYVFEPALSDKWGVLFAHGFNRYVATEFYHGLVDIDDGPTELERSFRRFMSGRDDGAFWVALKAASVDAQRSTGFRRIAALGLHFRLAAEEEVARVATRDFGKWLLDLSMTSIYGLLAALPSKNSVVYDVTCDHSKPLDALAGLYGTMRLPSAKPRYARRLEFAHSHESAGVQLADLLAGAALHVEFERPGFETLARIIGDSAGRTSVRPMKIARYEELNEDMLEMLAGYLIAGKDVAASFDSFVERMRKWAESRPALEPLPGTGT